MYKLKNNFHLIQEKEEKTKTETLSTPALALSPGVHVPCRVSGSAARRWPSSGACVGRPPLSGGRSGPWPSS